MASLEDVDDVEAGRALEKEAADEQLEFDDNGGVANRVRGGGGSFVVVLAALLGSWSSIVMWGSVH